MASTNSSDVIMHASIDSTDTVVEDEKELGDGQNISTSISVQDTGSSQNISPPFTVNSTGASESLPTLITIKDTEASQNISTSVTVKDTGLIQNGSTFINVKDTGASQSLPTPITITDNKNSQNVSSRYDAGTDQSVSTPVIVKDIVTPTPDAIPSRRSSRKKQSTFSSDFEYYTPGGRKIEIKSEPTTTPKARLNEKGQAEDDDEQNQSEEEEDMDEKKKPTKKKLVERKQTWKGSEAGDGEEDAADIQHKSEKWKIRVAIRKNIFKGSIMKKNQAEEEEEKIDEDVEVSEKKVTPKPLKGEKRKKPGGATKVEGKKMKVVGSVQEDDSSDEEESTPISQLKAQLREESTPISQLKAQLLEESTPISQLKAQLKEESTPISQLKAQLNKKRQEVKKTSSASQALSLMERFAEVRINMSIGSDKLPAQGQKRKLGSSDGSVAEEVPLKMSRPIQIDKLAPALASLVKRLPAPDLKHIKQKQSQNFATTEATVKITKLHDAHLIKVNNIGTKPQKTAVIDSSIKSQVKVEGNKPTKKPSPENEKAVKMVSEKTKTDKTVTKAEVDPKYVKKINAAGENVEFDQKMKGDVRHVTKVKIIRKPDGTIIKKKVIVPEGKIVKAEDRQIKFKVHEKSEQKLSSISGQKKVPSGNNFSKKLGENLASDVKQKTGSGFHNVEGTGLKNKHVMKKTSSEHVKKLENSSQKVEDLLKRGIIHKKKSHQPFGNKNLVKFAGKDLKSETCKDVTTKQEPLKKSPKVHKSDDKLEVKMSKDSEQRTLSDIDKHGHDRSHSSESNKGARRKSVEGGRKKLEKQSGTDDEGKDEQKEFPPPLTPNTSAGKPKHKHHKSEHEVPVDLTMMDLFKPDALVHHDQHKNNETHQEGKFSEQDDKVSQYSGNTCDMHSYVKPENVYNILIEHQYSKPTSPVMPSQDGQMIDSMSTGRDDDIESISHKQTVIVDVNLPEQILEESDEPVVEENTDDFQETWPNTKEELQVLVNRRDVGDRPSILESLNTELRESGTEFRIVGQVEVGRVPVTATQTSIPRNGENLVKLEKTVDSNTEMRRASAGTRKPRSEKRKDSTEKRNDTTEKKSNNKDRKSSTEDRKSSTEDRKSSTEDRKSSTEDRKSSTKDRKSSTEDKKNSASDKSTSQDKKNSASDKSTSHDKKYSTSDKSTSHDKKYSTSDKSTSHDKKYSTSDKSTSHDKKNSTDSRRVDKRKHKEKNKPDDAELKQDVQEEDDIEEHKFEDDQNDLDWEPNDTDTLYCICRKPHNNRFMICCDKCEEWFHGTCVGITRARGQEMEEQEEEYICPFCCKGDQDSAVEKLVVSSKAAELPFTKPKLLQRCAGQKCSKTPRPGSVYCSNECIMSHAQEALKAIREEQINRKAAGTHHSSNDSSKSSSSSEKTKSSSSSSSHDTVEVIERETGKLLTGSSAPTQKSLHRWLEQHPTFEVVLPHKHRSKSSSSKKHSRSDRDKKSSSDKGRHMSDRDRRSDRGDAEKHHHSANSKDSGKRSDTDRSSASQKSENASTSSKTEDKKDDESNQIRVNVRTALRDCLAARAQEADDIMLSSNEIKSLAVTIEEELFSLFNDSGHKYRTKYRSLVFNIKDQKNKGLFRKILTGKIKPEKLVQMSTEELANRELAKWREQASKHQLEMIEKTEQQALKESAGAKHVRKKTHKGDVEVEDEDLSILETRLEEKRDTEPEPQENQTQVPVIDTTDQHLTHVFDLNCKVCTGKIVPAREEQAAEKVTSVPLGHYEERAEVSSIDDKDDYEKAEKIVKEALQTMQKMKESILSLPKIVSSSPALEEATPPLSPKLTTSRRESSSSSASSMSSSSMRKKVIVRSPDSALQSGLEAKPKFTPTGPMLWKGFMSMLDVAKFFTSAYRMSGPTDHITIPDTINILGRISPDHMWDYLSKIRQAGSKDLTIVRFIPGTDDEKVAYIHLYSYLNSRGRCGVAANPNKQIKDFYIVPLASHSKIPRTLLPFDGPGVEENRPHMLIGVLVRQRGKHGAETSDTSSTGSGKSGSQSNTSSTGSRKSGSQSNTSSTGSGKSGSQSNASSGTKRVTPAVNRDPRLAKFAARETSPKVSPAESSSSASSTGEAKPKVLEEYEPEYIPMPIKTKSAYKPVAEYIPTPTVKTKYKEKDNSEVKKEKRLASSDDSLDKDNKDKKEKHHHQHQHHHDKKVDKEEVLEDDSDPYSPGKEAEPYSPGQEAEADEPYDPADESLMDDSGVPIVSSTIVSSGTVSSSFKPTDLVVSANLTDMVAVNSSSAVPQSEQSSVSSVTASIERDADIQTSELVEKMAGSNDPQEISSLMVTALSASTSPLEQQRLLVELTKKVEERKLQLAEAARQGVPLVGSANENENQEGRGVSSSVISAGVTSSLADAGAVKSSVSNGLSSTNTLGSLDVESVMEQIVSSSSLSAPCLPSLAASDVQSSQDSSYKLQLDNTSLPSALTSTASSTTSEPASLGPPTRESTLGIKFSITNSAANTQQSLSTSTTAAISVENTELKPRLLQLLEETSSITPESLDSGKSLEATDSQTAAENSGGIPYALKALMDDVMGNTQFSSLEKRRKMLLKKEVKKVELTVKEVVKEQDMNESQLLEKPPEVQKILIDEVEALKILDTVKKLEQTNSISGGGGSSATATAGSIESTSDVADAKKVSANVPPSIDELLDRLKRGGFQFPLQKAESSDPSLSSAVATTVQPSATTSDDISSSAVSDHSLFPTTTSTPQMSSVPPPVSSTAAVSSSLSSTSADLGHKNDLPKSSAPSAPIGMSSGAADPKATNYRDYDTRVPSALQDQDDTTLYQDRDDRLRRPAPPVVPKHPLDPYAFPPLPSDPRAYPQPPTRSSLPLPHGPLHPRFPLPSSEPHIPYHPATGEVLHPRSRAQPPPPGTESEKLPDDFLASDVDFRNRNRPLVPLDRLSPPLPPQPPPPLPPLPVNRGHPRGHYPHQSSRDVDYRSRGSYRPPPSHHHGRGDDTSYHRH